MKGEYADEVQLEKRAVERIESRIEVRFFYGDLYYSGVATNVSENGMYICTGICYPLKSKFEVIIPLNKKILKLPVKVCRQTRVGGIYDGMGVSLCNIPAGYMEFFDNFRTNVKQPAMEMTAFGAFY